MFERDWKVILVGAVGCALTAPGCSQGPEDVVESAPSALTSIPGSGEFHVVQEYFHDGGSTATSETADLLFDAASFKAVLTPAEKSYLAAHHPFFSYFTIPQELVKSTVPASYPQTLDPSYQATMAGLVSSYGIDNTYLFAMPEWDNDPGNASWAHNRFSDAGVTGWCRP